MPQYFSAYYWGFCCKGAKRARSVDRSTWRVIGHGDEGGRSFWKNIEFLELRSNETVGGMTGLLVEGLTKQLAG